MPPRISVRGHLWDAVARIPLLGHPPDVLRDGMVRAKGLEPPHLSILVPKTSASTNSATPARTPQGCAAYSKDRADGNPPATGNFMRAPNVLQCRRTRCSNCPPSRTKLHSRRNPASRAKRPAKLRLKDRMSTFLRPQAQAPSRRARQFPRSADGDDPAISAGARGIAELAEEISFTH